MFIDYLNNKRFKKIKEFFSLDSTNGRAIIGFFLLCAAFFSYALLVAFMASTIPKIC